MIEAIRFFRVVPPVPSMMITSFVIVTLVSVTAIAIDATHTRGILTAVVALQAFACSSGFAGHARRGHYDLLLTRGERRIVVAAAHWMMTAVPGIISWLLISLVEMVTSREAPVGFSSGSAAAIVIVSAIAWSLTAPLPRFTGAIAWLITIVIGNAVLPRLVIPPAILATFYPPAWIGISLGRDPAAAGAALAVALLSIVTTLAWVERCDIRLEAAQ
jgi:hypothetical protein